MKAKAKLACRICGGAAGYIGSKPGQIDSRSYHYYGCGHCGFFFVGNPRRDTKKIYNEAYYRGAHGDASVDYHFELAHPVKSIRAVKYAGILRAARSLTGGRPFRWLDYGCGNGALVAYAGKHKGVEAYGFDEAGAKGSGILSKRQLAGHRGSFDFISAIEVIEHVPEPLKMLRRIKSLLKPGGAFFLTTGNAERRQKDLLSWSYASAPDVHVSFFQPKTLRLAFEKAGLKPEFRGYLPGHSGIIRFKILKALGLKRKNFLLDLLPWFLISRVVDLFHGVSAQPGARRHS